MKNRPFKMIIESEMERYRAETFWTKEPETIQWIKSFSDGATFYDVGANIGIYSLYCAAIHSGCRVVSFEPHQGNFNRLVDNVILNGFHDRITCRKTIVTDHTGQMDFIGYSAEIGSSGGQMLESDLNFHKCVSIDDLVFFSFECQKPDYIKIDIDGQELAVVRGMVKTITDEPVKSVLVEIEKDMDEIVSIFNRAGFTTDNRFNKTSPHSRERRKKENIPVENIIFTRG